MTTSQARTFLLEMAALIDTLSAQVVTKENTVRILEDQNAKLQAELDEVSRRVERVNAKLEVVLANVREEGHDRA